MEKTTLLILLVLLASGCICSPSNGGTTTNEGQTVQTTTTVKSSGGGGISGALSDMAAAISSGQAYRCIYKHEGVQSEMIIKGQKFKGTTSFDGQINNMVSDGVWAYSWSGNQNTGVKFKIDDMKENTQTSGTVKYTDIGDLARTATDVQCTPTVVSDSAFIPPANIQFQDIAQLLEQLQGNAGGSLPSGGGAGGSGADEGDVGGNIQSTLCDACAMMPPGNPECSRCP